MPRRPQALRNFHDRMSEGNVAGPYMEFGGQSVMRAWGQFLVDNGIPVVLPSLCRKFLVYFGVEMDTRLRRSGSPVRDARRITVASPKLLP